MKKEMLDLVNEKDEFVKQETYEQVHSQKHLHRVVSAMLFNSKGEVLLQLRAKNKSAYPSHWSFSMGGHVRHGESYLAALVREGKEEIGVTLSQNDFLFRGKGIFTEHSGAHVIHEIYQVMYDGPIEEHTEEVDAVQFVDLPTLKKMLEEKKEKIHPQMAEALQKYFSHELGQKI